MSEVNWNGGDSAGGPQDSTLGGYLERHSRPPAFQGSDGVPYSVAVYVDEEPDDGGQYGAALLFVRWSERGESIQGHLETDYLAHGATPAEAGERLHALTLRQVKRHLDSLIASHTNQTSGE